MSIGNRGTSVATTRGLLFDRSLAKTKLGCYIAPLRWAMQGTTRGGCHQLFLYLCAMKFFEKFDAVAFISNIIAVILGIVITFSIQGVIDRRAEKDNIDSALTLVRRELESNRADLQQCVKVVQAECRAATFLLDNADRLKQCQPDSVSVHGTVIISDMLLTLPSDALELLKTSSLFPALHDNDLALKIIRAYDRCDIQAKMFANHEASKTEIINNCLRTDVVSNDKEGGHISMSKLCEKKEGRALLVRMLLFQPEIMSQGFEDIDNAIAAIDEYLAR